MITLIIPLLYPCTHPFTTILNINIVTLSWHTHALHRCVIMKFHNMANSFFLSYTPRFGMYVLMYVFTSHNTAKSFSLSYIPMFGVYVLFSSATVYIMECPVTSLYQLDFIVQNGT